MADDGSNLVQKFRIQFQQAASDWRRWTVMFFMALGFSALVLQLNWTNVPILGLLFDPLKTVMSQSGKFIRLLIASILSVFVFQWLRGVFLGGSLLGMVTAPGSPARKDQLWEFGSFVMIVFLLFWLWFFTPELLPTLFESTELMSIMGGG